MRISLFELLSWVTALAVGLAAAFHWMEYGLGIPVLLILGLLLLSRLEAVCDQWVVVVAAFPLLGIFGMILVLTFGPKTQSDWVASQSISSQVVERGLDDTYRQVASYTQSRLETSNGPVVLNYVVIVPDVPNALITNFESRGSEVWQQRLGANITISDVETGKETPHQSALILFDAQKQTVGLGRQTFFFSPEAVFVIQWDYAGQPMLTIDDGRFELPNVPSDVRAELRQLRRKLSEE